MTHVRKGDTVVVIAGKERGKRGKVLRVFPDKGRVIVERVNMTKKHQRPTQKLRQGGIIERLIVPTVRAACLDINTSDRTTLRTRGGGV